MADLGSLTPTDEHLACQGFREVSTISCSGFLVRHQHSCKLLQLIPTDNSVEVHLLQDPIGCKLLAPLILEECSKHAGTLLS